MLAARLVIRSRDQLLSDCTYCIILSAIQCQAKSHLMKLTLDLGMT
jgi:hypothetical protein